MEIMIVKQLFRRGYVDKDGVYRKNLWNIKNLDCTSVIVKQGDEQLVVKDIEVDSLNSQIVFGIESSGFKLTKRIEFKAIFHDAKTERDYIFTWHEKLGEDDE